MPPLLRWALRGKWTLKWLDMVREVDPSCPLLDHEELTQRAKAARRVPSKDNAAAVAAALLVAAAAAGPQPAGSAADNSTGVQVPSGQVDPHAAVYAQAPQWLVGGWWFVAGLDWGLPAKYSVQYQLSTTCMRSGTRLPCTLLHAGTHTGGRALQLLWDPFDLSHPDILTPRALPGLLPPGPLPPNAPQTATLAEQIRGMWDVHRSNPTPGIVIGHCIVSMGPKVGACARAHMLLPATSLSKYWPAVGPLGRCQEA